MAVREFNGTTDTIGLTGGSVGALCNGAYSIVAVVNPTTLGGAEAFFGIHAGTVTEISSLADGGSGNLSCYSDADDSSANVLLAATTWQIIAVTKAAGTVAPRFHCKPLGSGSWSHLAGGTTMTDKATTVTRMQLGCTVFFGALAAFKDCRIATAAIFPTALADLTVESTQTTATTQNLKDLGAVGLWDLNQASTATSVPDLIGTFNQSSISGTTVVVGDDPPGWTFGLSGGGGGVGTPTPLQFIRSNIRLGP